MPKSNNSAKPKKNSLLWPAIFLLGFVFGLLLWKNLYPAVVTPQKQAVDVGKLSGTYRSNLPAASGPGRTITLELQADGQATFIQDYNLENEAAIVESGLWSTSVDDQLVLKLNRRNEETLNFPQTLAFNYLDQNAGVLQLLAETEIWGSEGLTLQKIDPLIEKKWNWLESTESDGRTTAPKVAGQFALTFSEDGRLSVSTDCNNGMGPYGLTQDNGLSIGPLASTLMFCFDSQETEFFNQLSRVDSWLLQDDRLHLLLKLDSGTMTFAAIE